MSAARSAWNEAEHPREHGKFAAKGGGGGKKAPVKAPAQHPGGDWRKPEPATSHFDHAASQRARAVSASRPGKARESAAPGSWPGAEAPRAPKRPGAAAARFGVGVSRGHEAAGKNRAAAGQHITGGDIVKVHGSGQELRVVRSREWRGDPGYDVQTGSSSKHTTWFPASAVAKGRPETLDDIHAQRAVPSPVKKPQKRSASAMMSR